MEELKNYLPGWKTVNRIGKGGFGTVYEVEKEDGSGVKSALKVISIPQSEEEYREYRGDGYDDRSIISIFKNRVKAIESEINLMDQLKSAGNIVSYQDHEVIEHEDGRGWDILIRMELLTPLKEYVNANGFTEKEVVKLGIDLCSALEACATKNIIHRDIKPENIFVNEFGNYKLGDFGIARTMEHTTRGTKAGTFSYMAPEVEKGQPYNSTVDTYSLALVMYWLLNARRQPFYPLPPDTPTYDQMIEAKVRRIRGDIIPRPKNGSWPLHKILQKALLSDPHLRYESASKMKRELERCLGEADDTRSIINTDTGTASIDIPKETTPIARAPYVPEVKAEVPNKPFNAKRDKKAALATTVIDTQKPTDAVSLEDLENNLFENPQVEVEENKIERFYTLYKKNEEFQKLLDEEYQHLRLKGENIVTPVEEPIISISAQPIEEKPRDIAKIESIKDRTIFELVESIIGKALVVGVIVLVVLLAAKMISGNIGNHMQGTLSLEQQPTRISVGDHHIVRIRNDGSVRASGSNRNGECNVDEWEDVIAVSAGIAFTVGLKSDGTVVAAGYNVDGQCDVSSWEDIVAISAGGYHNVGLKSDGTIVATGENAHKQCNVERWKDIVAISAGESYTVGLRSNGKVVAVGDNKYGQCDVSSWKDIVAISAGDEHTVGLKSDGTVVATGDNEKGQCNVGLWSDIVAIAAGEYHTVGLKSDGTVIATGENLYGQCNVGSMAEVVSISAGRFNTLGMQEDGTIWLTPSNEYGQRTSEDAFDGIAMLAYSRDYDVNLKTDGTVDIKRCAYYDKGNNFNVEDWKDIVFISAGLEHVAGLKTDRTVVATGNNYYGQCDVSSWKDIFAISAGGYHTVGLKSDGTVVATGNNYSGQCNVGWWSDIVAISAGYEHTLGLKSDGTVVATGDNEKGQCNVGGWNDIVAISAGRDHTVGLKSDGTVVAAGDNSYEQCDVGDWSDIVAIAAGEEHTVGLKSEGTVVAAGINLFGECDVEEWKDVQEVYVNRNYTVGKKKDGTWVHTFKSF